jgi:hypothetical protein
LLFLQKKTTNNKRIFDFLNKKQKKKIVAFLNKKQKTKYKRTFAFLNEKKIREPVLFLNKQTTNTIIFDFLITKQNEQKEQRKKHSNFVKQTNKKK